MKLTYANAMSTLAVFLALTGGTALAVGLPKNSVTTGAVRNGSLRSADLAAGTVRAADVADGSVTGADLADGSLGTAKVLDGSLTGADLAAGSVGAAGLLPGAAGPSKLAAGSVTGAGIRNGSLLEADFGIATVGGRNIDESTLGRVPSASVLDGFAPGTFLSAASFFKGTFPDEAGIAIGDGTFKITERCSPSQAVVLGGGPMDLNPTTTLVESFPKENSWTVRINPHGIPDPFAVRVVCVLQNF